MIEELLLMWVYLFRLGKLRLYISDEKLNCGFMAIHSNIVELSSRAMPECTRS